MKIIKPTFEIWEQEPGLKGIYKQIERCGRVCYASDPIEGKSKDFVDRLINMGHTSALEHGTVYLKVNGVDNHDEAVFLYGKYLVNEYSSVSWVISPDKLLDKHTASCYITTNYRVLVENDWEDDLKYLCEPTEHHSKRVTVSFNTQIAISRELNRHRVNSINEQSTRYCNYTKDKFGGITVNLPGNIQEKKLAINSKGESIFIDLYDLVEDLYDEVLSDWTPICYWLFANLACEFSYNALIELGWKPEQARTILPLNTNTQVVHTAEVSDWYKLFSLRNDKHAHPDMRALIGPLQDRFEELGLQI